MEIRCFIRARAIQEYITEAGSSFDYEYTVVVRFGLGAIFSSEASKIQATLKIFQKHLIGSNDLLSQALIDLSPNDGHLVDSPSHYWETEFSLSELNISDPQSPNLLFEISNSHLDLNGVGNPSDIFPSKTEIQKEYDLQGDLNFEH